MIKFNIHLHKRVFPLFLNEAQFFHSRVHCTHKRKVKMSKNEMKISERWCVETFLFKMHSSCSKMDWKKVSFGTFHYARGVLDFCVWVVVGYWWWFSVGGGGGDSLCKGCSCNICRSAIVSRCLMYILIIDWMSIFSLREKKIL